MVISLVWVVNPIYDTTNLLIPDDAGILKLPSSNDLVDVLLLMFLTVTLLSGKPLLLILPFITS